MREEPGQIKKDNLGVGFSPYIRATRSEFQGFLEDLERFVGAYYRLLEEASRLKRVNAGLEKELEIAREKLSTVQMERDALSGKMCLPHYCNQCGREIVYSEQRQNH